MCNDEIQKYDIVCVSIKTMFKIKFQIFLTLWGIIICVGGINYYETFHIKALTELINRPSSLQFDKSKSTVLHIEEDILLEANGFPGHPQSTFSMRPNQ